MKFLNNKNKIAKALVITLELLAFALVVYLLILPFYPRVKYEIKYASEENKEVAQNMEKVVIKTKGIINNLPKNEDAVSPDRLVITKIGVNAPIVEAANADYGLSLGAWRVPESSTPDKGGNTVLTGHRFKYLPPSNLTFFLLDKMENGDIISVVYKEKEYYYRVKETKIVDKTETSILDKSEKPILTLFTCHPIYSTEKRFVVVGELVEF